MEVLLAAQRVALEDEQTPQPGKLGGARVDGVEAGAVHRADPRRRSKPSDGLWPFRRRRLAAAAAQCRQRCADE